MPTARQLECLYSECQGLCSADVVSEHAPGGSFLCLFMIDGVVHQFRDWARVSTVAASSFNNSYGCVLSWVEFHNSCQWPVCWRSVSASHYCDITNLRVFLLLLPFRADAQLGEPFLHVSRKCSVSFSSKSQRFSLLSGTSTRPCMSGVMNWSTDQKMARIQCRVDDELGEN